MHLTIQLADRGWLFSKVIRKRFFVFICLVIFIKIYFKDI